MAVATETAPAVRAARFTRRAFAAGLLASAAGVAFYSNEISRHELDIAERTFFIADLPAPFEGFRIVQISDIHLEEYTEDFFLRRVIDHVNALAADMVLVTGDFISRGPFPPDISLASAGRCAQLLATIRCPLRYGVLGNHDAMMGSRIVRNHMENNGLPLLVNQYVRVERGGAHVILGGIDDYCHGRPDLALAVPDRPDAPVILMAHEPDYLNRVLLHERGQFVDLMLSGHTHGGQIRLPGMAPRFLPPEGKLYPEGRYTVGKIQLYVNRGVGTVGLPFRLNCPPEITVATLRRAPADGVPGDPADTPELPS